jgi:CelD/BcsL family acetyltransferase involved in cellulose biosynthesis
MAGTPISMNRTGAYLRGGLRRAGTGPSVAREIAQFRGTNFEGVQIGIDSSLAACEELWRAAFDHCAGYVFQTFEWQSAYQTTIGDAEGVRPFIVHVTDRTGATLLLLPLGIYRLGALKVLRFLGGAVTDYNAPLIDRDFAGRIGAADFALLWRAIVARLPSVDIAWLRRMPETIEGEINPMTRLRGAVHAQNAYGARLPDSLASFKPPHQSDSRRQRKRLAEKGTVAALVPVPADRTLETIQAVACQKSRRWRETGAPDMFARPGYLDFYQSLTEGRFRLEGVHVSRLQVGETVVASHWGVLFNDRFYYLLPGFVGGEWVRYSCGRLLLESLFEWCVSHRVRVFDLTVGDERYKLDWSDHSLRLYEWLMPQSLIGALYVAYWRLRERLKRNRAVRAVARLFRAAARLRTPRLG